MSKINIDLQRVKASQPEALQEVARLKDVLEKLYPEESGNILLLCSLLQHGYVAKLKSIMASHAGQVPQANLLELSEQIQEQLSFMSSKALEALKCWQQVLSVAATVTGDKVDLLTIKACQASLLSDARRLESSLSDVFPKDVAGRVAVCNLLRYGLVAQLRLLAANNGQQVTSLDLAEFSKRADEQFSLSPWAATLGLRNWCAALDIKIKEVAPQPGTRPLRPQPQSFPSSCHVPPGPWPLSLLLPKNAILELLWCQPGTFIMGSPEGELGRVRNEGPQHQVTISKGFYLGKFPVTQAQYLTVMKCKPACFAGSSLLSPVDCASWNEAQEFCQKLNSFCVDQLPHGYKFCLPTEAQWEYACRAGTTSALNSGQNLTSEKEACSNLDQLAWYSRNYDLTSHGVGEKSPNAWGFYDMHGNVCEWCNDWFGTYSNGAVTDPQGPGSGPGRVYRGGTRSSYAWCCRSAFRHYFSGDLGFRLAAAPV